jgi:hypothetical protein
MPRRGGGRGPPRPWRKTQKLPKKVSESKRSLLIIHEPIRLSVYLSVRKPTCLSVFLSIRKPTCLSVFLYLSISLPATLSSYLSVSLLGSLCSYLSVSILVSLLSVSLPVSLCSCLHFPAYPEAFLYYCSLLSASFTQSACLPDHSSVLFIDWSPFFTDIHT